MPTYDFAVTSVISLDTIQRHNQASYQLAGSCGVYISKALAGWGVEVLYAGAHGADMPAALLEEVAGGFLHTALIPLDGSNATLHLDYNAAGDIEFAHYQQNSGDDFRLEHLPDSFWDARAFWLGTAPYPLLEAVAQRAKRVYLTTQNEFAGQYEKLAALAPHLTTLCTNTSELTRYGGGDLLTTLRGLLAINPQLHILATCGGRGAWLIEPPSFFRIAAYPAPRQIQAIGAGDTFAAAYAVGAQQNLDPTERLQNAAAAAAIKLRQAGYQQMPSAAQVRAYLASTAAPLPVEVAAWESATALHWIAQEQACID